MTRNRPDAPPDARTSDQTAIDRTPDRPLRPGEIAAWLRDHPDFLRRNPGLLDRLQPPERDDLSGSGNGVIDFQQAMVVRLRREVADLHAARDELVATVRANQKAQHQVQTAILALLRAPSFQHLIEAVTTDVPLLLEVDAVTLCVEHSHPNEVAIPVQYLQPLEPGRIAQLIGPRRQVVLRGSEPGAPDVYGPLAGLVASQALLRVVVGESSPPVLLALGSRDPDHFEEGQGTELLQFLGEALGLVIRSWLELPE